MPSRTRVSVPYGTDEVSVELVRAGPTLAATSAPHPVDVSALLEAALGDRAPERPLIVIPDRTRGAHVNVLLPPLLDRLERLERGSLREPPLVLFASGTHRPMSGAEMAAHTASVRGRVRPVAHDADAARWTTWGPLPGGGRAEVHPALGETDLVVVLSAMTFHYLAGLGGGRKMLIPGLASRATATAVHSTTITDQPPGRRAGIGPGPFVHNPMHQAIVRALEGAPPTVGICVVPGRGGPRDAQAGDLFEHHAALAERFVAEHGVSTPRARAALISAGGAPRDSTLIQAHKALSAAAPLLEDGARVVLAAACPHGLGHAQLTRWLSRSADDLLEALLKEFNISQQTAWSLRSLFDRFEVGVRSTLDPAVVRQMGATPLPHDDAVAAFLNARDDEVLVVPAGAALWYRAA